MGPFATPSTWVQKAISNKIIDFLVVKKSILIFVFYEDHEYHNCFWIAC